MSLQMNEINRIAIKTKIFLLITLTPISAYASSAGASALAGVGVALALMFLVGMYHLGKFATKKVSPQSPISLQRVLGVLIAFGGYVIMLSLLK
jgi:uncharacterized membrane protein YfbV (UPF0208 family)